MADYVKTRFLDVVSQLLNEDGYVTLQSLADKMGVSKRTMQHDVERIEQWLEESGLTNKVTLSKKQGNGIRLTLNGITRSDFKLLLGEKYGHVHTYDAQERRLEIAKLLLFSDGELTFQFIADQFYVSKSVIKKDMAWVEKWLIQYGLTVIKRQNFGIKVSGDEPKRRAAMAQLVGLACGQYGVSQCHSEFFDDNIDVLRLDIKRFYAGLNGNPKADVGEMSRIIREAEKVYGFYLMDSYYTSLLVHLSIAVERLIGKQGTVDSSDYPEDVLGCTEGEIASYIAQQIEDTFHVHVPDSERAYICIHLMGAKLSDPVSQDGTHSSQILSFTIRFVSFVEELVGIRFLQDDILLTALATHIKTSVFRLQSGMSRLGPYSAHIHPALEPLYRAVWAASYFYKQAFGLEPLNEELLSVYLHFVHSLRRRMHRCRTVFLYQCDIIRAEDIYQHLVSLTDSLEICQIRNCNILRGEALSGFDLVITTGEVFQSPVPVVQINPLLPEEAFSRIRTVVDSVCHSGFALEHSPPETLPCVSWTKVSGNSMECVMEALAKLEDLRKYDRSALARERRALERNGRGLVSHGTALLPIYLPDVGKPRAHGFSLSSPIDVADGKAARLIFMLLEEPQADGQWDASGYSTFVQSVLRAVDDVPADVDDIPSETVD